MHVVLLRAEPGEIESYLEAPSVLQCFDTAGWVIIPVKKSSPKWTCAEWDVAHLSRSPSQARSTQPFKHRLPSSKGRPLTQLSDARLPGSFITGDRYEWTGHLQINRPRSPSCVYVCYVKYSSH